MSWINDYTVFNEIVLFKARTIFLIENLTKNLIDPITKELNGVL